MMMKIPLARADVGPAEAQAVARVMARGRLARGPEIDAFEREFAAWLVVDGAVAMNSGTSALIAALRAFGVGPGDEVIMPALTFIATANAILNCGATPVLVDVDPHSWNLDPQRLEDAASDRTRAIVAVHLFGLAAPMNDVLSIAHDHQLVVIEDACEAIGAEYQGRRVGGLADAGVFGFYPNKVLTTGEGGMVVANAEGIISRCRAIANQGRGADGSMEAGIPGFSFRSSELAAALGRVQLRSLDERLAERTRLSERYARMLASVPSLGLPPVEEKNVRSWVTFPVLLPTGTDRAMVMQQLDTVGIETADYFPAVHKIPGYCERLRIHGSLTVSTLLAERLLSLPFWSGLEEQLMDNVVAALTAALAR